MRRSPTTFRVVSVRGPLPSACVIICDVAAVEVSAQSCTAAQTEAGATVCINDAAVYTGAKNEVLCGAGRIEVGATLGLSTNTATDTCPAGMQVAIDSMYTNCDKGKDWETEKPAWKDLAVRKGCAGAAQAMPAVVLVAAAVRLQAPNFPSQARAAPARRTVHVLTRCRCCTRRPSTTSSTERPTVTDEEVVRFSRAVERRERSACTSSPRGPERGERERDSDEKGCINSENAVKSVPLHRDYAQPP